MRTYLLDDSRGLCVAKTRSNGTCAHSGGTITAGTHAVGVRREYDDNSFIVWVSLGSVDGLIDRLRSFTPSNNDVPTELSPCGRIRYNETSGATLYCAVCEEHMPSGTKGYSFYNPAGNGSYAWLHTGDCTEQFCDTLGDVWEYTPELLGENV